MYPEPDLLVCLCGGKMLRITAGCLLFGRIEGCLSAVLESAGTVGFLSYFVGYKMIDKLVGTVSKP